MTGIVIALHQTSQLSKHVVKSQWAKQEARSLLTEIITTPQEGTSFERDIDPIEIDEYTTAYCVIEPHEALDKDGNQLEDLYKVSVTITWDESGSQRKKFSKPFTTPECSPNNPSGHPLPLF